MATLLFRVFGEGISYYVSFLKQFLNTVFGFAFAILIAIGLAIIYTVSIPTFLFRFFVIKLAKALRSDLGSIVSAQGNIFSSELLYSSSKSPRCSIIVPIVLEGHYTEDFFETLFLQMIYAKDKQSGEYRYPEFRQYVYSWFGFAFWKNDPKFELRSHLKFHDFGWKPVVDTDISLLVELLLNKPFQPQMSPWEVYIVPHYEAPELPAGDKTVLVFRFSHTLADGFSILHAISEGLLQAPLSTVMELPKATHLKRTAYDNYLFHLMFPFRALYDVSNYFLKALRNNPWYIPDSKKSWKQHYGKSKLIPVDKIKEIKNKLKVSFTSVILSAISAGASRTITDKMAREPKRIACFIPLPVPGHPNALRNHVTGAQIDLPLEDYSDPRDRVRDCENSIQQQKASTIPVLLLFIARTLGLHMSSVCGEITRNVVNPTGLTNFSAGSKLIRFGVENKAVLGVDLAVGALTGVSGVAFMAISYEKYIRFAATAEHAALSRTDLDKLLGYITEEIELLHEITSQKISKSEV